MKEILITGGHFAIINGEVNLNAGTIKSFENAVKFHKKRIKNSVLGVLINDIGTVCGVDKCSIIDNGKFSRENFVLPSEYRDILEKNDLSKERVQIFWEKHIRNRASKFFRKKIKEGFSFIKEGGTYFYKHPRTEKNIPVSKINKLSKYGVPTCALIVSSFSKEIERRGFKENFNIYYTGKDNFLNIPNPEVLDCGMLLSDLTEQKIKVENILFN